SISNAPENALMASGRSRKTWLKGRPISVGCGVIEKMRYASSLTSASVPSRWTAITALRMLRTRWWKKRSFVVISTWASGEAGEGRIGTARRLGRESLRRGMGITTAQQEAQRVCLDRPLGCSENSPKISALAGMSRLEYNKSVIWLTDL